MTGEEFAARYRILRCVSSGGINSFEALSNDGRATMVHFLEPGSQVANETLLASIDRLPEDPKAQLIEVVEVDSVPVVATLWLPDFVDLPTWVKASGRGGEPSPDAATMPHSSDPAAVASDFTQLLNPEPDPPSEAAGDAHDPAPPAVPTTEAAPEEGSFTSFLRPDDPEVQPTPVVPPSEPTESVDAGQATGPLVPPEEPLETSEGFTQLLQPDVPLAPPSKKSPIDDTFNLTGETAREGVGPAGEQDAKLGADQAGGLTGLFGGKGSTPSSKDTAPAGRDAEPPAEAGKFTQMFEMGGRKPAPQPPARTPGPPKEELPSGYSGVDPDEGYADQLRVPDRPVGRSPDFPPRAPPPSPPPVAGPSEYTLVMQSSRKPKPPAATPPAAPVASPPQSPAASGRPSAAILFGALALLLIAAVVLIVLLL